MRRAANQNSLIASGNHTIVHYGSALTPLESHLLYEIPQFLSISTCDSLLKTTKLLTANFFVGEDAVKCGCKGKKMWLNDAIGEQ